MNPRLIKTLSLVLFAGYLLVLFKLLFFKLTLNVSDIAIGGNADKSFETLWRDSNFIPFYRLYYYASGQEPYLVGAFQIIGNVLAFVPLGFFGCLFFSRLRRWRPLLLWATGLCLTIEVLQLLTATGQFDADDVLLNVAGVCVGAWLWRCTASGWGRPNAPRP